MKRVMYLLPPLFKMEPPQPFAGTLNHGDLRSDNIFCPSESDGGFAVIGWQPTGIVQLMKDIVRWVTRSISINDRRETKQAFSNLYYDRPMSQDVTDYSDKKMMQDYQLNLVLILVMFTMTKDDIDQTPERADALFRAIYCQLDAGLVDWKVFNLLEVLPYLIPLLKLSVWIRSTFSRTNHD